MISKKISFAILLILILVGIGRIAATYDVFSHTTDEGAHIAAGMQLLDKGHYTLEPKHPPLARVATALGPYMASLRSPDSGDIWTDGFVILYADYSYFGTLARARAGTLVFFVIGMVVVWAWARHLVDEATGIVAALLFSLLPVVLAHSGLATTDMAITATLVAAVYAVTRWIEHPTKVKAAIVGGALALTMLSKLTALLLLPVCLLAVLVSRFTVARPGEATPHNKPKRLLLHGAIAAFVCLAVIWGGYGFSLNPLATPDMRPHETINSIVGVLEWHDERTNSIVEAPIYPLVELAYGIRDAIDHGRSGHPAYLLGELFQFGTWLYYPVAIFFKTPLPFLLLVAIGLVVSVRSAARDRSWQLAVPMTCAAAILLAMLPSTVNIGVRHVLPMFPFLAIVAAVGAVTLYRSRGSAVACKAAAVLLVAWMSLTSVLAHPDYLAYFNLFAGPKPEEILVDSDLDWGQDQERLSNEVYIRGIEQLCLLIGGPPPYIHRPFPPLRPLHPYRPASGWIAISMTPLKLGGDAYAWLDAYQPVTRVGRSILLYNIPANHDSDCSDGAAPASD